MGKEGQYMLRPLIHMGSHETKKLNRDKERLEKESHLPVKGVGKHPTYLLLDGINKLVTE